MSEHLKMQTPDSTEENIAKIAALFPSAVTEMRDEDGGVKKGINFETLKQLLSHDIVDGKEHYEFTWVGKKQAMAEAARPTTQTLRPVPADSKNWDTTQNLYIEGDNLEVLKILQQSYLGKVKMIYIDPPYNTGSDSFTYPDNYNMDAEEYAEKAGALDENGNRLFKENNRSNPRFHSDWCSMTYERLMLARNFLAEDGVIFISIDDNEEDNLIKLCDEVFGESNYLNHFAWVSNITGRQISGKGAAKTWESILAYAKDSEKSNSFLADVQFAKDKMPDTYKGFNKDIRTDDRGMFAIGDTLYNHNRKFNEETRPNLVFSIYYNPASGAIEPGNIGEKREGWVELPPHKNGDGTHKYHAWRWSRQKIANESYDLIVLPTSGNSYEIYTRIRDFNTTLLKDLITNISNGDSELQKLFEGKKYFDYPKSVDLVRLLVNSISAQDMLVMDFFSGSATTAHAVMQLNAEDGGHRKFIMVQLPEPCDEKSEAYKAGYKNICEIGKERIRRAGEKIKAEHPEAEVDTGFRVFRVDSSNMKDVYFHPEQITQTMLGETVSNIKEDRTDLDLLYDCMLRCSVEIDLPHTTTVVDGCKVHNVDNGALMACFDPCVTDNVIHAMAQENPVQAIFRDSSFATDADKINVTEIFKNLSPDTKVRVI